MEGKKKTVTRYVGIDLGKRSYELAIVEKGKGHEGARSIIKRICNHGLCLLRLLRLCGRILIKKVFF